MSYGERVESNNSCNDKGVLWNVWHCCIYHFYPDYSSRKEKREIKVWQPRPRSWWRKRILKVVGQASIFYIEKE